MFYLLFSKKSIYKLITLINQFTPFTIFNAFLLFKFTLT